MSTLKLAPSLKEQISQHLRRRILAGEIAPGSPLLEEPLAQEFGISRGPIRDAFLTLGQEGLLVAKPNVGVRVAAEPSPRKRAVIVAVRRTIEDAALAAWFETREPALLETLARNVAEFRRACAQGNLGEVVEIDMEFHRLLVGAADQGSLLGLWQPAILQMYLRYSRHRSLMESYEEHAAILAAMRKGAAARARKLLAAHIQ
jgi:DNA-binding GntR family transcriptional regulator